MTLRDLNLVILIALVTLGCAFVIAGYSYRPPEIIRVMR